MSKGLDPPVKGLALGIDPSYASTGMVLTSREEVVHHETIKPPGPRKATWEERVSYILERITPYLTSAHVVAIEGAAWGKFTNAYRLGLLTGALRFAVWEAHLACVVVSPTAAKKFATGRGHASKEEMVAASRKWLPYNADNNIADALFLALWALHHNEE